MARQSSSSASISLHLISIIYEAQGLRPWRVQDPVAKLVTFKLNPPPRAGTAEPGLQGSGGGGGGSMPCVVTSPGPWQPLAQGPGMLDGARALPASEPLSGRGPQGVEAQRPLRAPESPGSLCPSLWVRAGACVASPPQRSPATDQREPPRKGPGHSLGHSGPRRGSRSREPQGAGIRALRSLCLL